MQKWEYKVLKYKTHDSMSTGIEENFLKLGKEGWELIGSGQEAGHDGETLYFYFYFKKPISEISKK